MSAVKSSQKKPILGGICIRVARRQMYNTDFLWREDTLTKGILAVAVTESPTFLNSEADKKSKGVSTNDRGKFFRF
jgi:hypothetical protein